jgi:hypothetical protein
MLAYDYALEPVAFALRDWLHFLVIDWPLNLARMGTWRTVEAIQHNFPAQFGRKPGRRMMINPDNSGQSKPALIR